MTDDPRSARAEDTRAPEDPGGDIPLWQQRKMRHIFMLVLSVLVVGMVLGISWRNGKALFNADGTADEAWFGNVLLAYLAGVAGVLIFIMNIARKKREKWAWRDYWGDHVFRVAQTVAYLFVVMWAWAQAADTNVAAGDVPPVIVGFLTGLFILRVERAMEGLGVKFEEVLMTVLPRSFSAISAAERQRQQTRALYKLDDIVTQYEAVRPNIDDLGAREKLDGLLNEAQATLDGEEPEAAKTAIESLAREFEIAKRTQGDMLVPLEELLGTAGGPKPSLDRGSSGEPR